MIKREIRPLDFVLTPGGNIALVSETSEDDESIKIEVLISISLKLFFI